MSSRLLFCTHSRHPAASPHTRTLAFYPTHLDSDSKTHAVIFAYRPLYRCPPPARPQRLCAPGPASTVRYRVRLQLAAPTTHPRLHLRHERL